MVSDPFDPFDSLLLELLEDRQQRGSVIVTSQLPVKLWHGQFQDPTLADAILDRLVHNPELVELTGEPMQEPSQWRQPRSRTVDSNPDAKPIIRHGLPMDRNGGYP